MFDLENVIERVRQFALENNNAPGTFPNDWSELTSRSGLHWLEQSMGLQDQFPDAPPNELVQLAVSNAWADAVMVCLCYARDYGLPDFMKDILQPP